tara:strand:+ start:94 stop:1512 length:1419 start_codon:yes stop_codon:yes gene_type:complete
MQTLFKPNLFSSSSSKVGAKNFVSGGKKLGSSIVGAAKNNIIGFNRTAQAMMPEKKEEKESSFIKNYTNFFGSKKTEKILRKNLKLVRDSLVNTFEIARHLKAAIISISGGLKGGAGKGGGLFGGFMDAIKTFLTGALGGALIAALPILLKIAAVGGLLAFAIALWKNEKFKKATLNFLKESAEFIWESIKSLAIASIKWMFGETEHSKEVKQSLSPKVINANIKEHGAEKTLEMLRDQYARDKESGFLDSFRAKRDGIEDEYIRRMTDVERKISKQQGTKNIVSIMEKEVHIRKEEIRKKRNNSPELKAIIASKDKKAYDAYRSETLRLMKETETEIRDKYQQILLKGADGGSIHESMIEGKKWEGSTAFDQRTSSSSVSSDSNSEVNAVKSDLTSMNFENFYDDGSLDESKFSFAPITFNNAQGQDSSGGEIVNASGGSSPGGNAVTFYSSSNSDPSYHKLNALMTFNIV